MQVIPVVILTLHQEISIEWLCDENEVILVDYVFKLENISQAIIVNRKKNGRSTQI